METARELRRSRRRATASSATPSARLFHDDGADARRMLREKAVLEDLENAVDQCELVAETLPTSPTSR
jgi:hypothetical protein